MVETMATLTIWAVFSLIIIRYVQQREDGSNTEKIKKQLRAVRRELEEMEQSNGFG